MARESLYEPSFEHDACGFGFVCDIRGRASAAIVRDALQVLVNLEHRGATGAEPDTGDGAGLLVQLPHAFLAREAADLGIALPAPGAYGVGMVFLPREAGRVALVDLVEEALRGAGLAVLGWRDVPTDDRTLGPTARASQPAVRQVFVARPDAADAVDDDGAADAHDAGVDDLAFERRLFVGRRLVEKAVARSAIKRRSDAYLPSLSSRTIVYKGMLNASQLGAYYPDLADPDLASAIAMVHSRFSTNTFPSWSRAHPYRFISHNGEINTLRGNVNWMRAREATLRSAVFGADLARVLPVIDGDGSDSAMFDNVLELLHLAGRSLPHAVMMMIPEPWSRHAAMSAARRDFFAYHAALMEPWDGPASIAFTDGTVVGATLDRNGLRPARYWVTADGRVVMASETGVLDIPASEVVAKGRLEPGRMFVVDTAAGRIVPDEELKAGLAAEQPYGEWIRRSMIKLPDLPAPRPAIEPDHPTVMRRQETFGYTSEEIRMVVAPMAVDGAEPIGSMGDDAPLAVLSDQPRLLPDYFTQLFAQVTNPPLDAIREEIVTAVETVVGPEANLLEPGPEGARQLALPSPVLRNTELEQLRALDGSEAARGFRSVTLPILFPVAEGGPGLRRAIEAVREHASAAIAEGSDLVILSDRGHDEEHAPIPALLAVAAVHHHLLRSGTRTRVGLVLESGEPREVHHVATLIGYGASAVNPYLAFETIDDLVRSGMIDGPAEVAERRLVKAITKGVVKVASKMGISAISAYHGAQVFEAIGLSQDFVDEYFTGTPSRIGGIGIDLVADEVRRRHDRAYPGRRRGGATGLAPGGRFQYRDDGEAHLWTPQAIHALQRATRNADYAAFKEYSGRIDAQERRLVTLRSLLELVPARHPVSLDEVEPVESIVRRFKTGAMSYGSISAEAHEALAVAMNRLGGRSNTGEGGEDPARYRPDPNGDSRVSAIKQVASARFGVTSEYLVSATEIQIKMAQGAKPGEGGQLPGHKVYPWIAAVRHATPGVGLISPPPHHDIYSIEDLAELIYDLRMANSRARISVKLVSEVGVGTVAAGVAKAHADVVLISGHDGGTGASPLSSIKHAGAPWELGLAEAHQVLVANDLRSRIVVEVDGQLRTGRDVVVGALLGAQEFGFATAPLVALGCVMMRACHLNTCPVGIATQDPELRARYGGDPDHVVAFMRFVAAEVREHLATVGLRSLDEAVGRSDLLAPRRGVEHAKARRLDLGRLLHRPRPAQHGAAREQDGGVERSLDARVLLAACAPALDTGRPVHLALPIRNTDRAVGTLLGSEVTRRHGAAGLPDDTIDLRFRGSAGQSFGAFLPRGITLRLAGDANDYLGKGLSGGRIVAAPPDDAPFAAEEQVIAGNVACYGATSGEVFLRGIAGERFCVRNSGATAVVEGVGDHGCEYMTGGRVVILGRTGRNFAAGMSGGIAYVLDADDGFAARCNQELVGLGPLDDPAEVAAVRDLVERHLALTGSAVAARLLGHWEAGRTRFVRVIPHDYRRALRAEARHRATGLEPAAAALAAFDERARGLAPAGDALMVAQPRGFVEIERAPSAARPPLVRVGDWRETTVPLPEATLREQGARCMDCGIPFCHAGALVNGAALGCPVNNLIPEWNELVARGQWEEAYRRLAETNDFPEVTGRVCPAPCEGSCTVGLDGKPVTIKAIEAAIVDRAWNEGWIRPEPPVLRSGHRVAVVGSGPAGLAAAAQLNRRGHLVTVYERADRIGGLMMYGIPAMKLAKELVERRVDLLRAEGIVFEIGVEVGRDLDPAELVAAHDAVILATGSTVARDLSIPGRELAGVHLAMDYLAGATRALLAGNGAGPATPPISAAGRDVVVIGGGDTGTDCVATAVRQGARSLVQLEILPRPPDERAPDNPWPQWPRVYRLDYGQEEAAAVWGADPRAYAVATRRFVAGEGGRLAGIEIVDVAWQPGPDGRLAPVEQAGTERTLPADLVLLALGFSGPERSLPEQLGCALDARGTIVADEGRRTTVRGIFAAGDCRRGQSLVVWAIREGRRAAAGVDEHLATLAGSRE